MTRRPTLEDWRGRHAGEAMMVLGCGHSLAALADKPRCVTIGVNDVGRRIDPDYLVVVNPRSQFPADRLAAIEATRARAVFTSVADLGIAHPQIVRFELGRRGGTSVEARNQLPYTRNSPYIALALALLMGARRIGLLGVDFTPDHFFGATGTHPLARELDRTDAEYGRLAEFARQGGVEIVNLSAESRLTSLPRQALETFLATLAPRRRVLHVSRTNCAGAIWNLHRLMQADGRVDSRVATASALTAAPGRRPRRFPQDIAMQDAGAMRAALAWADLLHFHNFTDAQSRELLRYTDLLRGKPAVLQVHSEPAVLAAHFPGRDPRSRTDLPVLVVAQKQARFYPNATPVLNALMPADFAFMPGAEAARDRPPRVVFTPTDLGDYPAHPPTCRGKGYRRTRAILERLAASGLIAPVIRTDLDFAEAMALSRGAAAKIDECVTGGYHLTSLEALAQGLATFAWLDPETRALLARMTGSSEAALPWVSTPIDDLEERLAAMARAPEAFAEAGAAGRSWIARHWTEDAVLGPILAAYDRAAAPVLAPLRPPQRPEPGSGDVRVQALTAYLPGCATPRRSEDHAQRIRLGVELLAREGSLAGAVAHVLGNGPSLARTDLRSLSDGCVIGINAAVPPPEALGRPLDYYCISDRRFLAAPEGRAAARSAAPAMRIFAGYCDGFLADDDIHYIRILPGDSASCDLRQGVYHGCSVALFAAQIAVWLGAGEVRLHGMECDYGAGRFDGKRGHDIRPNDHAIYPRVARCAAALAALLERRGGRLSVAGPSRLTGGFGATPVPGIAALPIASAEPPLRAAQ